MPKLTDPDLKAIDNLFQAYGMAWGQADAAGCAALYAADGDAIAIDGTLLSSPLEIRQYYEKELSGKYAGVTVSDFQLDPARPLSADVALLNVSWRLNGVTNATQTSSSVLVRATFVVRREASEWRFVATRFMVPFGAAKTTSSEPVPTA